MAHTPGTKGVGFHTTTYKHHLQLQTTSLRSPQMDGTDEHFLSEGGELEDLELGALFLEFEHQDVAHI